MYIFRPPSMEFDLSQPKKYTTEQMDKALQEAHRFSQAYIQNAKKAVEIQRRPMITTGIKGWIERYTEKYIRKNNPMMCVHIVLALSVPMLLLKHVVREREKKFVDPKAIPHPEVA